LTNDPNSAGPFTLGASAIDTPPIGDVERQAVASLRGYAYQVAAAALAWLDVGENGRIYLEVAEDYATVAQQSLDATQVKDTAGSGSVTLNTEGVRDAVDASARLALPPVQFRRQHCTLPIARKPDFVRSCALRSEPISGQKVRKVAGILPCVAVAQIGTLGMIGLSCGITKAIFLNSNNSSLLTQDGAAPCHAPLPPCYRSHLPLRAYVLVGLDRGIRPCGWFHFLRPWFHLAPWGFWRPAKINSNKTQSEGRGHLGSSHFSHA
jgi:hypothetical protein